MTALYNHFKAPGASIKFFPEYNVIFIEPLDRSLDKAQSVKNKLETVLSVDSSNVEQDQGGNKYFSLQVSSDFPKDSVQELLRSQFRGGDEVQDITQLTSGDEQDQQQQTPPQQQQIQASLDFTLADVYQKLHESIYRTGEFWDDLRRVSGRENKNKITEDDLLRIRKEYVRKPESEHRNKILQATDKALKYFSRKIRDEKGEDEAESYKEEFRSYGDLRPDDYQDEELTLGAPSEEEDGFTNNNATPSAGETMKIADLIGKIRR